MMWIIWPNLAYGSKDTINAGHSWPGRLRTVHTYDYRPCMQLWDSWAIIVKGNHFWCCFCVYSGKRISASERNSYCHYCNKMIPGNEYLHHVVSSN